MLYLAEKIIFTLFFNASYFILTYLLTTCFAPRDRAKIGGAKYFWSFPAKKDRDRLTKLEELKEKLEVGKRRLKTCEGELEEVKVGREEGEDNERSKKLQKMSDLQKEKAELEAEQAKLKENDPAVIDDLKKEVRMAKESANRWTDNIFSCKVSKRTNLPPKRSNPSLARPSLDSHPHTFRSQAYLTKKRGMSNKEAFQILQITSSFDYPEEKIVKG